MSRSLPETRLRTPMQEFHMDSISQVALGSAVGIAVMGRRTSSWKAALWGGVCGTLPDLDVLIDHGDPIRNMTFHRAESHVLFHLSLLSPLIAWLISRIHREGSNLGDLMPTLDRLPELL